MTPLPGLDPRDDLGVPLNLRPAQLPGLLEVQPQLRRRPEIPRQRQRRVGRHSPLTVQDLCNPVHRFGEKGGVAE